MDQLKTILEGFSVSWLQVTTAILIVFATYLFNQLLLKVSIILFGQQILWIRKMRYWVPVLRILAWTVGIFLAIRVLSPPTELVFALATSAGVAVGLAAQELVKNIFGAVIIWSDKVYQEGDRVKVNEVEGIVQSIGLRSTKVWAYDDTIIVVPNSTLLNATVYNSNTGEAAEQIIVDMFLPIDVDTNKASELARLAALSSDLIELNKPLVVQTADHIAGRMVMTRIRVKAYVRNVSYEKTLASDISARAKALFRENELYGMVKKPEEKDEEKQEEKKP